MPRNFAATRHHRQRLLIVAIPQGLEPRTVCLEEQMLYPVELWDQNAEPSPSGAKMARDPHTGHLLDLRHEKRESRLGLPFFCVVKLTAGRLSCRW